MRIANPTPILKSKSRILRPIECRALIDAIPKPEHKTLFEVCLYTGCRICEIRALKECPEWFDGRFIKLCVGEAVHKHKIVNKDRWVRLNPVGRMAVRAYLMLDMNLPSNVTWRLNLRRWARYADISEDGLSAKCLRKTWESWLAFYYPDRVLEIIMSQGHTEKICVQHYLNLPFTEDDRKQMTEFVDGWI